ncbi:MAG TPA: hypothetical protein PKA24_13565 [Microthrixaceae bacterium]|nr:hypothetical protein [Acidimicrobiales bacterium]HMT61886.1 hypothetical protein [Microthrixaceae bacterium]
MKVSVDFCGEVHDVTEDGPVVLGRDADLVVDDNPFLHRRFLEVSVKDGLCWLTNLGSRLSATVVDEASRVQAWVAPGARLPIVFEATHVRFTAGPTTYELTVTVEGGPFAGSHEVVRGEPSSITETIGQIPLTPEQKLLIVALAEPLLRQEGRGNAAIPSSADAARRLGWLVTKFNRKLDNVCDKLDRAGVRGLHGEPGKLASNRRARLVEYAVSVGLVTPADLASLDEKPATPR